MIERLKRDHRNFESELDVTCTTNIDIVGVITIMRNMSEFILQHEVVEEVRLMRVIMQYGY